MKRLLKTTGATLMGGLCICVLAIAFSAMPTFVEAQRANLNYIMTTARTVVAEQVGAYNAFASQAAVGQTAAYVAPASVLQFHTIQVVTTGAPATCTYRLQGSNDDGTSWFDISAADITCTTSTVAYEANKVAKRVRGNLLTLTGGTAPTVTLKYAGR